MGAQPQSPTASTANATGMDASSPVAGPAPVAHVPVPAFDRSMGVLLSNEESKAKEAVILLLKIISNIIDHPLEEKYRKIKCTSKAFSTKLGALRGGNACIEALGFVVMGEEWVLAPSASAWDTLLACQAKLDRFMARFLEIQGQAAASIASATSDETSSSSGGASASAEAMPIGEPQVPGQDEVMNQAMQLMLRTMMMNAGGSGMGVDAQDGACASGGEKVSSS